MRKTFYVPLVLLSSALLVILFVSLALSRFAREREDFDQELASRAERTRAAFQMSMAHQEAQLLTLSTLLSNSPRVAALFSRGREAVLAEGGGGGGAGAAAARGALLGEVETAWQTLQQQFGLHHLDFYLAPGAQSFLRVQSPGKFGDRIDAARPLVVDVNRDQRPRSGYEVGPLYASLRGVAPIVRSRADGSVSPIGAVETGGSFEPILSLLDRQLGAGLAVVLDRAQLDEKAGGPLQSRLGKAYASCDCYLDTTTRPELRAWLAVGALPPYEGGFASSRLEWQGRSYQLVRFPLRDYLGALDARRPAVGSVLVWSDISEAVTRQQHQTWRTIGTNILGFLVAEVLLLMLLRYSRDEWRRQLDHATAALTDRQLRLDQALRDAQASRQEIESLSRRNELLLMSVGEGIFGMDRSERVIFINPAALQMLGYQREEVIGRNGHQLFHPRRPDGGEYPSSECPISRTLWDGETRHAEDWLFRKDGSGFPVQITVTAMIDDGVIDGAVTVFQDIEARRRAEEEMLRLATTDTLTGLPNRRSFMEQGTREMQRVQRFSGSTALLMLDLDFFKRINDTYGHSAGDAALCHFANLARQRLRRVDIFGRVGGEEFAALLPGTDQAGAREWAERLRSALEQQPAQFQEHMIPMTVSIGITLLQGADTSLDHALSRADTALYQAKHGGRNRVETML